MVVVAEQMMGVVVVGSRRGTASSRVGSETGAGMTGSPSAANALRRPSA